MVELVGAETLARLRARHAELLARISERVADHARREQLRELAQDLNPDTWVTHDEARAGLEQFEQKAEQLRSQLGRRRRRSRRGGARRAKGRGGASGSSEVTSAQSDGSVPDATTDGKVSPQSDRDRKNEGGADH